MATITLDYDSRSSIAKDLIAMLLKHGAKEVKKDIHKDEKKWAKKLLETSSDKMGESLKEAITDIAEGNVVSFDNKEEMFEYLNS
jgi:ADP-ribosylglycohydrolase